MQCIRLHRVLLRFGRFRGGHVRLGDCGRDGSLRGGEPCLGQPQVRPEDRHVPAEAGLRVGERTLTLRHLA